MREMVIDADMLAHVFATCAEYTGREVMSRLSGMELRQGGAERGSVISCRYCGYCQAQDDGSMHCRNLHGLDGRVGAGDGCSRGKSLV